MRGLQTRNGAVTLAARFARQRLAIVSLAFLLTIGLAALLAPVITHFRYDEQHLSARLEGPSLLHWMGTDGLGRDLYSRVVYGARTSLAVGLLTAALSLVLGTLIGTAAGYFGGWVDVALMRLSDLMTVFPSLLLAILLMVVLGHGLTGILLAIGITSWISQARLIRGVSLQLREMPYIESARALGLSDLAIIRRHIFPNLLAPLAVSLTFQTSGNIMAESFLSFVGLGIRPPNASWGTLASDGFNAMQSYPHLIFFPSIILFGTMLAFSYLGDGLVAALDLKLKPEVF